MFAFIMHADIVTGLQNSLFKMKGQKQVDHNILFQMPEIL